MSAPIPPPPPPRLGAAPWAPGAQREAQGILFDMDGTLVNSIQAIERVWGAWAARHGLSVEEQLRENHGTRAIDTMRKLLPPGLDLEAEAQALWREECAAEDVFAVPGAAALLAALPPERWALVTSADPELMRCRMAAAGLPLPAVIVTAHDVQRGKPDPEPYQRGAAGLGLDPKDCLVFEDAAAGLASAAAAGCPAVAVTTTFTPAQLPAAYPWIADFADLQLQPGAPPLRLHRRPS